MHLRIFHLSCTSEYGLASETDSRAKSLQQRFGSKGEGARERERELSSARKRERERKEGRLVYNLFWSQFFVPLSASFVLLSDAV